MGNAHRINGSPLLLLCAEGHGPGDQFYCGPASEGRELAAKYTYRPPLEHFRIAGNLIRVLATQLLCKSCNLTLQTLWCINLQGFTSVA